MCGIAALFDIKGSFSPSLLPIMTNMVRHRGPDDEGMVYFRGSMHEPICFGGDDTPIHVYNSTYPYSPKGKFNDFSCSVISAALGHRRLSIIDLSPAGHQPMCSRDQRLWGVYNGEIYNYIDLRKELEDVGYMFHSNTDTEVILNAYSFWGSNCLNRFNGMFAFVIFDRTKSVIFAARDRYGVKPLYYWLSPRGYLALASEIKQFTVLPGWQANLNGQRAYDFLRWSLNDHTRETLFKDVLQIRGGEFLECPLSDIKGELPIRRWYELKKENFDGSFEEASAIFRDTFTDAVSLRLRADVPVGTSFSGGLDSSSIVYVVNELLRNHDGHAQQKTFSSCSYVKKYDERHYIDEVVKSTHVDAHFTYPSSENLFADLGNILWHHDEPFLTTSIYAEWLVFNLVAKNGVKVTLDGHGGDELLAGYYAFYPAYFSNLLMEGHWATFFDQLHKTCRLHHYNPLNVLIHMANLFRIETASRFRLYTLAKPIRKHPWINTAVLGVEDIAPEVRLGLHSTSISDLSIAQLLFTSLPKQLHWADRDSMAHSVESRLPFLDYRLVEFILSLPDQYKMYDGITKRVLRHSMLDLLPPKIRLRMDKMGFVTPEELWFRELSSNQFLSFVNQAIDESLGVIRPNVLPEMERMISGKIPYSSFIWRLITFGMWMGLFQLKPRYQGSKVI